MPELIEETGLLAGLELILGRQVPAAPEPEVAAVAGAELTRAEPDPVEPESALAGSALAGPTEHCWRPDDSALVLIRPERSASVSLTLPIEARWLRWDEVESRIQQLCLLWMRLTGSLRPGVM